MILEITEHRREDNIIRDFSTYLDNIETITFHCDGSNLVANIEFGIRNASNAKWQDFTIEKMIKENSDVVLMSDYGYTIDKFSY